MDISFRVLDTQQCEPVAIGDRLVLEPLTPPAGIIQRLPGEQPPVAAGLVLSIGEEVTRCEEGDVVMIGASGVPVMDFSVGPRMILPQGGIVAVLRDPGTGFVPEILDAEPDPQIVPASAILPASA